MTVVVDAADQVLGVFTDGDLRRALDRQIDVHATDMRTVMTAQARSIGPKELAADGRASDGSASHYRAAGDRESGRLVGALNVHDLLRAGVM